ncbi:MAG TPA: diguanylate cyclase [Steroidobacteraceae bacterium]|nr:diguanylate cyclase [Steroidobacteraceae bacterium]
MGIVPESLQSQDESQTAQVLRRGYRWLRFPEPLEEQYRDDHRAGVHRLVRMAVIVAFITSAGFAFIDFWLVHAANSTPTVVRFGLQLPVLIVCLLATSRRFYLRWYEPAIRIGLPLFGFGTVLMTANSSVEQMPLVGARLLLVTFFCYFMLGIRMRTALACNAIVFLSLIAACVVGAIPAAMGSYLAFAMLCANIIGGSGAYALEYAHRTAFLDRLSLEEMAARDGLTRLLNRQTFEFRARNAWRNATTLQRPLSVLMIDVDYFKRYNDTYGHQAGDECLQRIATALRTAIKPQRDELVARYGGEEFVALLLDRSAVEIETITHNIVDCISRQEIPHAASICNEFVSVSVGASSPCIDPEISYSTLAHVADKALYVAKHQGRNRAITLGALGESAEVAASEGKSRPEARGVTQRTPIAVPAASI